MQDIVDLGGPDERFGVLVVHIDEFVDGADQVIDAGERTPSQLLVGELAEPALNEVQLGAAGRCEVKMKTRVLLEPLRDLVMLVGAVVVEDQV